MSSREATSACGTPDSTRSFTFKRVITSITIQSLRGDDPQVAETRWLNLGSVTRQNFRI